MEDASSKICHKITEECDLVSEKYNTENICCLNK